MSMVMMLAAAAVSLGGWKGETVSFRFDHTSAAGGGPPPAGLRPARGRTRG